MTELIVTTPTELRAIVREEVSRAMQTIAANDGELWGVGDLAAHYHVAKSTIIAMRKRGELPARIGTRWRKADVIRWDSERAS